MGSIRALCRKILNREMILYILFGVLTTVVDYAVFWLTGKLLGDSIVMIEAENVIAWCAAVCFAFVTNKWIVFQSRQYDKKTLLREAGSFVAARLASLFFSMVFIWAAVEAAGLSSMIAKVLSSVFVIIINYVLSKLIIFRRK